MNVGDGVPRPVDFAAGGEDALIIRPAAAVEVRLLPPGGAEFAASLTAGKSDGQRLVGFEYVGRWHENAGRDGRLFLLLKLSLFLGFHRGNRRDACSFQIVGAARDPYFLVNLARDLKSP